MILLLIIQNRAGILAYFDMTLECFSHVTTKLTPEGGGTPMDLAGFSRIILAGPIWWYTLSVPLLTWVRRNKAALTGKRLALMSLQSSNGHVKALQALKAEVPEAIVFADVFFNEVLPYLK